MNNNIASFDIDGVIFLGKGLPGINPGKNDIIITGRSFQEEKETMDMLESKGIFNKVYFNPIEFKDKTRESSGEHKAKTISKLIKEGIPLVIHFEDDEIQSEIIERSTSIHVVKINHNLTEKENVRHSDW